MKIPDNYCPTCTQKALAKIDLETEASERLHKIKNAIIQQGAFGGPKAALAEVCYLVNLPIPEGYDRTRVSEETAANLLIAIANKFRRLFLSFLMHSNIGAEAMMLVRSQEERAMRERQ